MAEPKFYPPDDPFGPAMTEKQHLLLSNIIATAEEQEISPDELFSKYTANQPADKAARFRFKLKQLMEDPDLPAGVRPLKTIPLEKTAVGPRYWMSDAEMKYHTGLAASLRPKDLRKISQDLSSWRSGLTPIRKEATKTFGKMGRAFVRGTLPISRGLASLLPSEKMREGAIEQIEELRAMTGVPRGAAPLIAEIGAQLPAYVAAGVVLAPILAGVGLTSLPVIGGALALGIEGFVGGFGIGALEKIVDGEDPDEVLRGASERGLGDFAVTLLGAIVAKVGARGLRPLAMKVGKQHGHAHPAAKILRWATQAERKASRRVERSGVKMVKPREQPDIQPPEPPKVEWRERVRKIDADSTPQSTTAELNAAVDELSGYADTLGDDASKIKRGNEKSVAVVLTRVRGLRDRGLKPWEMTKAKFNATFAWHHTTRANAARMRREGMRGGAFGIGGIGRTGAFGKPGKYPGDVTVFTHHGHVDDLSPTVTKAPVTEKATAIETTLQPDWSSPLPQEKLFIVDRVSRPHEAFVRRAVEEGKDVPDNVRKEYGLPLKEKPDISPTTARKKMQEELGEPAERVAPPADVTIEVDETIRTDESGFGRGLLASLKRFATDPEGTLADAKMSASRLFEMSQTLVRRSGLGEQMDILQRSLAGSERSAATVVESIEKQMSRLRKKPDVPNPHFGLVDGAPKMITAKEAVSEILVGLYRLTDDQWKTFQKRHRAGTLNAQAVREVTGELGLDPDALEAAVKIKGWQKWLAARLENLLDEKMVQIKNINWDDPQWDTLKELAQAAGLEVNPEKLATRPFIPRQDFGYPITVKKELLIKGSKTRKAFADTLIAHKIVDNITQANDYMDAVLLGDGLADLHGMSMKPGARAPGSLKFQRQGYLSEPEFAQFIERDPDIYVARYFRSALKYMDMQDNLGLIEGNGLPEQINAAVAAAGGKGIDTQNAVSALRVIIANPARSAGAERLMQLSAAKSLVLTPLENTSGFINNLLTTDLKVFKKAMYEASTAEGQAFGRRAGAPATTGEVLQEAGESRIRWLPWIKAHAWEEGVMRMHAALCGRGWAEKMGQRLIKNADDKLAISELGKLRLDAKKFVKNGFRFTDDELVAAGQEMINRTQFRANPMYRPLWASSQGGSSVWRDVGPLVWQFKTWIYGQGRLQAQELGLSTAFGATSTTAGRAARFALMQPAIMVPLGYGYLLIRKVVQYRGDTQGVYDDWIDPVRRYMAGDDREETRKRFWSIVRESWGRTGSAGLATGILEQYPRGGGVTGLGAVMPSASLVMRPALEMVRPAMGQKIRPAKLAGLTLGTVGAGLASMPALATGIAGGAAIAGGRVLSQERSPHARLGAPKSVSSAMYHVLVRTPKERIRFLLSEDITPLRLAQLLGAGRGQYQKANSINARARETEGAKSYGGNAEEVFAPALQNMVNLMTSQERIALARKIKQGQIDKLIPVVKGIVRQPVREEETIKQAIGAR